MIIKNYRLRLVDAKSNLTERDFKIMKQNKGTNILVSNSLIKPEIYRFSTKVTGVMAEVFDEMKDKTAKIPKLYTAENFESLTYANQMELEEQLAKNFYNDQDYEQMKDRFKSVLTVDNLGLETGASEIKSVEFDK